MSMQVLSRLGKPMITPCIIPLKGDNRREKESKLRRSSCPESHRSSIGVSRAWTTTPLNFTFPVLPSIKYTPSSALPISGTSWSVALGNHFQPPWLILAWFLSRGFTAPEVSTTRPPLLQFARVLDPTFLARNSSIVPG